MYSCSNCGHQAEQEFRFCPTCGTRSTGVQVAGSLIGRTLNEKYHIVSEIGTGGMGTVYLGEHLGLKKRVALKVLHSDLLVSEESLQRFQREGIAAGKFNHANAIQIFDFDRSEDGTLYLAMEFIEGPNLKTFLARKGRVAPAVAVDIVAQVLSVLSEAHANGIIHRDLKPDNIMVVESASGSLTVKVLDFGLSKLVDIPMSTSLQTQAGRLLGTPLYMAPEQCSGEEADARSDIYAVGLILYELLTGITAFPDETATEIIFTRPKREAPSMAESHPDIGVPHDLDAIVRKALQRRREDRYQSAAEMLADLEDVRLDVKAKARPRKAADRADPSVDRAAPAAKKPGIWVAAVVGVLIAVGAAIGWTMLRDGGDDSTRVREKPEASRTPEEIRYVILLEQIEDSLLRGDPDAALTLSQRAVRTECVDSEGYYLRARAYRGKGETKIAIEDLREALALDPDYAAALGELGWLQLETDDVAGALASFGEALELQPGDPAVLTGKAVALQRTGSPAEAEELLEEAVATDPSSGLAQLHLGELLFERGELERAREALQQAKRNGADVGRTSSILAEVALREGDVEEARRNMRTALEANPDLVEMRYQLAASLIEAGETGDAIEVLDEGLRRNPKEARLQILNGVANETLGDRRSAIAALERGLREAPEDARGWTLLGQLYQEADRDQDALRAFDRAIAADPRLFAAHLNRALTLFAMQRVEEAAASAEEAVRLEPEDAYTRLFLGVLYMEYLGRGSDALMHLSAYAELDGSDRRVERWLRELGG